MSMTSRVTWKQGEHERANIQKSILVKNKQKVDNLAASKPNGLAKRGVIMSSLR